MTTMHERAVELRERVAAVLRGNWLSKSQIQERFGLSPATARRVIDDLQRERRLVSRGRGKFVEWSALSSVGGTSGPTS